MIFGIKESIRFMLWFIVTKIKKFYNHLLYQAQNSYKKTANLSFLKLAAHMFSFIFSFNHLPFDFNHL